MLLGEKRPVRTLLVPCLAMAIGAAIIAPVLGRSAGQTGDTALGERAQAALRKAVEFYRTKVATEGGYHFAYAEDLSYGRSEMSEGPTRVEIQRDGTPLVGMAYLDAYQATGDTYYRDAARDVARALPSILPEVENPSEIRRRACPGRTPCAARFYELKTNRPLYVTKGTRVTAVGQGVTNVDGYELSYSDQSVITHYAVLTSGAGFSDIEKEYKTLLGADASSLTRPDRLQGLSPWTSTRLMPAAAEPQALEPRVRAVIESMDARGAWVEDGAIGKADRLVSVLAGRDLVVTLGGKTLTMKENETLEVFSGPEPPKQRIIRSRTFADNVGVLSAYLAKH
jgi:hypothetical protein